MKQYIKSSESNSIIEFLAKRIADMFNEDIKVGDFDGWEHYVMSMGMTSSDIKEEILSVLNYIWDKDREHHKGNYSVADNGTIYAGDDEYSYRKFKNIVMKYVIHDTDEDVEDYFD